MSSCINPSNYVLLEELTKSQSLTISVLIFWLFWNLAGVLTVLLWSHQLNFAVIWSIWISTYADLRLCDIWLLRYFKLPSQGFSCQLSRGMTLPGNDLASTCVRKKNTSLTSLDPSSLQISPGPPFHSTMWIYGRKTNKFFIPAAIRCFRTSDCYRFVLSLHVHNFVAITLFYNLDESKTTFLPD